MGQQKPLREELSNSFARVTAGQAHNFCLKRVGRIAPKQSADTRIGWTANLSATVGDDPWHNVWDCRAKWDVKGDLLSGFATGSDRFPMKGTTVVSAAAAETTFPIIVMQRVTSMGRRSNDARSRTVEQVLWLDQVAIERNASRTNCAFF